MQNAIAKAFGAASRRDFESATLIKISKQSVGTGEAAGKKGEHHGGFWQGRKADVSHA